MPGAESNADWDLVTRAGFYLVNESREAYLSRLALIDMAERSLDAQYYLWKPDLTGSIMVERLVQAVRAPKASVQ